MLDTLSQAELIWLVKRRCLLEGCRYGIEGVTPVMDRCIYCGAEKPPVNTWSDEDYYYPSEAQVTFDMALASENKKKGIR